LNSERRVARFNETLDYIKRLWTEEDLTFEGEFFQIKNANLLPKPLHAALCQGYSAHRT